MKENCYCIFDMNYITLSSFENVELGYMEYDVSPSTITCSILTKILGKRVSSLNVVTSTEDAHKLYSGTSK